MRFVVVTGMSGAGKRTALKMLEDIGYNCVDNLPVSMLEKFVELISRPNSETKKVALGLDVRADLDFESAKKSLDQLRENGYFFEILFVDANDTTLIKRYKESRRLHPLSTQDDTRVETGIRKERVILESVKKKSNYVIDTSKLLTRELKEEIDRIFIKNEEYNSLMINILSFGFKNGYPSDADLMFDVRFLPNPFYVDELKKITGNEEPVKEYVLKYEETKIFLEKLTDLLEFLLPYYIREGKHQVVIAIGCTGGQHRSVTIANELYKTIKSWNYGVTINHRDI
ncbi:MAG: RNase adapter RapZ [Lachnospiraceae bacterium]